MKKTRISLIVLLVSLAVEAFAYDRATYYSSANGKKGADLKTALYNIIKDPSVKSYGSLWTYYYQTDRLSDNQVVDRYSNEKRYFSSNSGNAVSGMNKEHGIPQSWWGGGTTGIGSDIHHVMPSDTEANSRKSNYGMGVVTSQSWTNGSIKVGKGTAGNNGTVQLWEPADEWKGDFARIYFYIVTCYEEKSLVQKEGANSMQANTYPKLQPWAYELYLKWSKEDPVDDRERVRNEKVFTIQGNRNPFIDYEGLEQYIWGDHKTQSFSAANYESPYEDSGLKTPAASFSVGSVSMNVGDIYTQQVETESEGTVTYESSNAAVALVDNHTGMVTAVAEGVAYITATIAATSVYRMASATYTVVVKKSGGDIQPIDGSEYVKVITVPSDWSGVYLIVYEAEDVALDGGLETFDKQSNTVAVDIKNGVIPVTAETEKAEFIVSASGKGYSFLGKSGKYMGATSGSNGLATSTTPLVNTLSLSSDGISIESEHGNFLRFNSANGQKRFRYYKSGQQPITLYRRTVTDGLAPVCYDELATGGDDVIYDLTGRRVQRITRPGLYIIRGKKTFMK